MQHVYIDVVERNIDSCHLPFTPKRLVAPVLKCQTGEQENVTRRFPGSKLPWSLCARAHMPTLHMNNNTFLDLSLSLSRKANMFLNPPAAGRNQ